MKYFLFDKAQKYVTRINTEYLIEAHYTEEINTAGQLEFTLPATMRLSKNVFYVCVTDPDDETSYLMFKIVTEKVTDEKVTYTCIENAYDELSSYNYIKDKRPTAIADYMLKQALEGTRWSVGQCPTTSQKFCSFYYISVLEAIQKIVNLWGLEVQFQVKIDDSTNEIKQRNVNLFNKLGKRTNKRFEYGSSLLSVTQANDSTGLYTALVGRGKGVQVSEGDTDTDPDGYGRRITFADVVWSTQSGNPLNKPAGQEYLEDPNATAAYGFPDGHPRIGFVVFQDCEDPNELIQLTYNKLQEVNHPQVQFSANIADVGSLNLGDTIAIIRHDIGIEYYTRVFKVVHDLLDSSNNTVELGDNIAGSNSITQQISTIKDNQSNVQNAIDTIVMNGADGNKLFFGTEFPANGTDGDIFYKTLENGGTEMYIYKDGGWQLVVSTEELNTVQKKVDEQTSQIQQAVDSANSAVSKADEAVAQVGDANTNAQKALTTAQQNQADLAQAKNDLENTKNQLTNVQSDLTGTKSSLAGAISNISQAQEDLKNTEQGLQSVKSDLANDEKRLSGLTKQSQQQGQTIVNIQKTQSGLSADIADVKGNVSSLQDTANGLQATIKDNQGNISKLQDTANGIESTVSNMRVGGTNLLRNTKLMNGSYWFSQQSPIQSYYQGIGVIHVTLDWWNVRYNYPSLVADGIPNNTNDVFTFSCLVKKSDKDSSGNISFFCGAVNVLSTHINQSAINADYWTQIWVTFKFKPSSEINATDDYANSMRFEQGGSVGTMLYTMFKLEKGSMPTAYSPAPQDTDDSISSISQKADKIESTVQTNSGNISSLQQTAKGLQGSISDNKNDIANVKATAQGLQATVADNKNNISSLKQTAQGLESTVSNMRVGGTNLLRNTKMMNGSYWFSQQSPIQSYYQGIGVIHVTLDWWNVRYNYPSLVTDGIPNNTNDVFTFSCLVKKSDKNSNGNISFFCGAVNVLSTHIDQSAINADYWTQIWVTFKFKPSSEINATDDYANSMRFEQGGSVGTMLYTMFKLEKGSMPTAYSPAPQDTDDSISSISQKADSIQSTVQSNIGQISQMKQTADSLQSTITQGIGAYLPNGDFDDKVISKYWVPWDTTKDLSEVFVVESQGTKDMPAACLKIQTKSSENKTDICTKDFIPFNINEPIEIKAWSWLNASNGNTQFQFYIHCYDENHNEVDSGSGYFKYDNLNEWEMTDVTFDKDRWNKNTVSMRLEVVLFGGGIDTAGYITGLKIINGSSGIASQFTQTIDSLTSKIADADGNISQLKQTSDSLTSQIGNANNDISSLKQRADSMESNISDNKNDISDLRQTASSLQSVVSTKADLSQVTQMGNVIQSVVQNIGPFYPDGDFSDVDLGKYYDPWDTCPNLDNFSVVTNNKDWGYYLQIRTPHGTINKAITKEYLPINAQYSLTFKGKSLLSYGGKLNGSFMVYMHFFDSNKNAIQDQASYYKYDNNNVWQDFSLSFTPPSNAAYVRVETVLDNSNGDGTYWGALDNLSIENGEATIASKISQMSDDINLRVQKGDLLSQINIEAGQTLIQSDKLYLDASSVVFSGNAFIPSAAITDLSADKITTGTLNGANVHVINMDVANLVGDTTSFVRSQWQNAYGSYVNIDGGGMSVGYGNWFTKFDSLGMTFTDSGDDLGGFTRIGMHGAPSWYGGLAFNAGGDAEFLSIGAKDYHNDTQNPIPGKLVWMRQGINTYGYTPGWNFEDDVWTDKIGINSIQYDSWNIHFGIVVGSNNFSALTLTSGSGDGFYWGSDGSFGYVVGETELHNVRGSKIVRSIDSDGTCNTWDTV